MGSALAQEPPDVPVEPEVPPPLLDLPRPFGQEWWWVRFGPSERQSDIAIHPSEPNVYAIAALDGSVSVTMDGGVTWVERLQMLPEDLGPPSPDEEVRGEVEARVEELVGEPETSAEGLEDLDQSTEELIEAAEEVSADMPWLLEQARVLEGAAASQRPRVWFSDEGWLFAGRADGLYRSVDLGATFERVLDVAVTSLTRIPGRELWVAGTADGVRFSTAAMEARIWIDAEDGTEGIQVYDLDADALGVYAATSNGIWFAPDAQDWTHRYETEEAVTALLVDPDWEQGLWFSTPDDVYRSDDGARSATTAPAAPVRGVVAMTHVGPGHVLVSGTDGPWESMDGGVTWIPIPRGLSDPDCRGMALHKGLLLLSSDEGLFRLEPVREGEVQPPAVEIPAEVEWVGRSALVDGALRRPGMTSLAAAPKAVRYALPRATLRAYLRPSDGTSLGTSGSEFVSLLEAEDLLLDDPSSDEPLAATPLASNATTRLRGGLDFYMYLELRWTMPGGSDAVTGDFVTEEFYEDAYLADDVVVDIDPSGEVYVSTEEDASTLASRVSRRITEYRNSVAMQVNELYYARQALLIESGEVRTSSLLEQVEHRLRIAEVEARLDYLSDGVVSRYRTALLREEAG